MSGQKHTPGPWKVVGTEIWGPHVRLADGRGAYDEKDRQRRNANARLIAAAPDLLAALEDAAERMEIVARCINIDQRHKGVSPATHVRHTAAHLAAHAKFARAAIAKAEGGAA
jgi:hypothetical protein